MHVSFWQEVKFLVWYLNTIGGRWYFGRVLVPLKLKNQSLYHKILLLQKFNDTGGKVLKPKKISLHPQKKNEAVSDCVWLCLMAVVYQDPKFLIFQKLHNQQNQTQWHKVNYFDFCFVSKCLHISNSRYKPAGLDF